MARKYSEQELRKLISGAVAAWLSRQACICSDDPYFHDQLWEQQKVMVRELKEYAAGGPPVPD